MAKPQDYRQYQEALRLKEEEWEKLCRHCGGCCGAYDDPCLHLAPDEFGKFYCRIYQERLGQREALSGEEFDCVSIRKILHTSWKKDYLCNYKKHLKA